MPLTTPDLIDRYQVLKSIGEGGMGALYLARDPAIDRLLAIKLLRENNAELRQRFASEARSAGRLHHPNIVTIFDVGEYADQPFIAMEYIQGETLGELGRRQAVVSLERKLEWMDKLCAGLHYAHRAGIIHRDIKPANIMIDEEANLKILDFGIARFGASEMTQAGMVIGTLNYMAPEQMMGKSIDARADQFSVGAVFYELLTYKRAFPGDLNTGIVHKILSGNPESLATLIPGLDEGVIAVVARCLEKDPDKRFADLAAMRKELASVRSRIATEDLSEWGPTGEMPVPQGAHTPPSGSPVSSSGGRKSGRQGELARMRAEQVQANLAEAKAAFAKSDWNATLKACQQALLLSADNREALDLEERAQAALEQENLKGWLKDAQGELDRGALTAASLLVDRALSLSSSSPDAVKVREQIDQARDELAQAQERARKLDAAIARARHDLQSGALDTASAAASEAIGLDPANAAALALKQEIEAAVLAKRKAQEEERAKSVVDAARRTFAAGQVESALQMLSTFSPAHELVSRTLGELQLEAKEIERRREIERLRQEIAQKLEEASAKLKASDFQGALASVGQVLAREPQNAEALAVKGRIGAAVERQKKAEAEQKAAAEAAARLQRELEGHVAAAAKALEAKDLPRALDRVESALRMDPNHAGALELKARIGTAIDEAQAAKAAKKAAAAAVKDADVTVTLKAPPATPADVTVRIQKPVAPPTVAITQPVPVAPTIRMEAPASTPAPAPPAPAPPPTIVAPAVVASAATIVVPAAPSILAPPPIQLPRTPAALPSRVAKPFPMAVVIGLAAVALLAIIVGLALRSRKPAEESAVGGPPALVGVAINIAPWAKIDSIVSKTDQKAVNVADAVTPCILSLAPGGYHVRASNPNFPGTLEFDVTVAAGGPGGVQQVNQVMPGFQPEQEINSILNQ